MKNTVTSPVLTPEVLERCNQHGADQKFLDSIEFLDGPECLKHFIELAMNTEPGTTTKEALHKIAVDKSIAAEGVPCPGAKVRPFRFWA